MRKFLITILFMLCSVVSYSQAYASYTSDAYMPGINYSEISSYTMWNVEEIDEPNASYLVQFYHNLNDLPQNGKILVKLDNDKIIEFSYTSNPTTRLINYEKNGSKVEYAQNYKMQVFINNNELLDIAAYSVKKIRIQTVTSYYDLKTNIFNALPVGYANIKNQIRNKSLYNNF